MTRARAFHLLTFLVAAFALILQLVLVIQGNNVLNEDSKPDLATRLVRYASYLTIWSNALVAWTTFTLAFERDRDTRVWRALRLNAVVICFAGGVVHFFLLRPDLNLDGADLVADKLLHMVVPLLALVGWLVFGPRGRASGDDLLPFLRLPVFWLIYTLARGAFVDWYPYPFIDVGDHGYGVVLVNCFAVAVLIFGLAYAAVKVDQRLSAPRAEEDLAR